MATDTYRLGVRKLAGDDALAGTQYILSDDGIAALQSLLKNAGAVCVSLNDRQAKFALSDEGKTVLYLRLVAEKYPNFNRIIPADLPSRILLPVAETIAALKRLSLYVDGAKHTVWQIVGETLIITAQSSTEGNAEEIIDVAMSGVPIEYRWGMNVGFAIDALSNIGTEAAHLHCPASHLKPFRLEPVSEGEADRLSVLMPMNAE